MWINQRPVALKGHAESASASVDPFGAADEQNKPDAPATETAVLLVDDFPALAL
jgi:hypothetical protein